MTIEAWAWVGSDDRIASLHGCGDTWPRGGIHGYRKVRLVEAGAEDAVRPDQVIHDADGEAWTFDRFGVPVLGDRILPATGRVVIVEHSRFAGTYSILRRAPEHDKSQTCESCGQTLPERGVE